MSTPHTHAAYQQCDHSAMFAEDKKKKLKTVSTRFHGCLIFLLFYLVLFIKLVW